MYISITSYIPLLNVLTTLSSAVLYTVAKHARQMGAYKLARHTLEKIQVMSSQMMWIRNTFYVTTKKFLRRNVSLLQSLIVPASFHETVDRMAITIRAKPFLDKEVSNTNTKQLVKQRICVIVQ